MFNFGLRGGDLLPRLLRLLRLEALPTRSRIRPRTDVLLLWSELVKLNGFLSVVLDLSGLCPPPCLRHLQVRWLNFVIPLFLQSLQYTTLQTTQRRLYLCVFFFIRFHSPLSEKWSSGSFKCDSEWVFFIMLWFSRLRNSSNIRTHRACYHIYPYTYLKWNPNRLIRAVSWRSWSDPSMCWPMIFFRICCRVRVEVLE